MARKAKKIEKPFLSFLLSNLCVTLAPNGAKKILAATIAINASSLQNQCRQSEDSEMSQPP